MRHHYASSPWDIFADLRQPSVYVISDSEMKRFKEKNTRAEIAELERIVADREQSLVTLRATIEAPQERATSTTCLRHPKPLSSGCLGWCPTNNR